MGRQQAAIAVLIDRIDVGEVPHLAQHARAVPVLPGNLVLWVIPQLALPALVFFRRRNRRRDE